MVLVLMFCFFFFQAEDGIRDVAVTGVQTCALPIYCYQYEPDRSTWVIETDEQTWRNFGFDKLGETEMLPVIERVFAEELERSEERRVGKEWRSRGSA